MNHLKSRLLRQQELQRHPFQEVQKRAPRNLSEATSAYEVNVNNPPLNQYTKPTRYQILQDQKVYNEEHKKTTIRKILDEIQQEAETKTLPMAAAKSRFESTERGGGTRVIIKRNTITYRSTQGGQQFQQQPGTTTQTTGFNPQQSQYSSQMMPQFGMTTQGGGGFALTKRAQPPGE